MTSTLKLGDVCICSFPFTSGQFSKPRPVLVLLDLEEDCLIARITSVPHTGLLDVPVTQWREAGLEKTVRRPPDAPRDCREDAVETQNWRIVVG